MEFLDMRLRNCEVRLRCAGWRDLVDVMGYMMDWGHRWSNSPSRS